MQFSLQLVSQRWQRNPLQVAGDILHIVIQGCNLKWFKATFNDATFFATLKHDQHLRIVLFITRTALYIVSKET